LAYQEHITAILAVLEKQSPLYQLLKQNRRIKAWLGVEGDGDGVNVQQTYDFIRG